MAVPTGVGGALLLLLNATAPVAMFLLFLTLRFSLCVFLSLQIPLFMFKFPRATSIFALILFTFLMDLGAGDSYTTANSGDNIPKTPSSSSVYEILLLIQSDDLTLKVQAAREIRRLTKTSKRYRRYFSNAVKSLVHMLHSNSFESKEAALLALLNLAVKDERYFS